MKTKIITIPHTSAPWSVVLGNPKSAHPEISIRFPGYDGTANGRPKAIDPFTLAHLNTNYFIPHLKEALANAHVMAIAPDVLEAFQMLNAHYSDIAKSNPGFMGKLCLQDYELWNKALLKGERVMNRLEEIAQVVKHGS